MNYGNQNLRELLAGEYVLGLLRGAARRRFERLLIEDARVCKAVVNWEQQLTAWNRGLEPLTPPDSVWRKLQARLRAETRSRRKVSLWAAHARLWSGAVMLAPAFVLVVGVFIGRSLVAPRGAPAYIAVMANAKGRPLWLISVHSKSRRIDMQALANNTPPAGKSYELWMLPGHGKPVAMGLMNSEGLASASLDPRIIAALVSAKDLAISIEPYGGSPTGQPTGPVVYVAPIVST